MCWLASEGGPDIRELIALIGGSRVTLLVRGMNPAIRRSFISRSNRPWFTTSLVGLARPAPRADHRTHGHLTQLSSPPGDRRQFLVMRSTFRMLSRLCGPVMHRSVRLDGA